MNGLEAHVAAVEEKGTCTAEYFCDERDEFLNKVFEEMWNFVEVFEKCRKVIYNSRFIVVCNWITLLSYVCTCRMLFKDNQFLH